MSYCVVPQPNVRQPASCWLGVHAVVVFGLVVSSAVLAQEGVAPVEPAPADASGVACTVSGYDVIIRNNGTDPIASGASVAWFVPFARMDGSHTLTKGLEPGGRVFLAGALGSNFLSSKAECEVTLGAQAAQPTTGDVLAP